MKLILKLILAWAVILLTAVSCSNDSFWDIDEPLKEGESQVILRLKAPGGYSVPRTRAMSDEDENRIETIDVLIFDRNNKLLMIKQGEDVSSSSSSSDPQYSGMGSFSVVLPASSADADDKYKLLVLANAHSILNDRSISTLIGRSYTDVVSSLWDRYGRSRYVSGGTIPMSGVTDFFRIVAGDNIVSIPLTRAIARIDVGVGTPSYDVTSRTYTWSGRSGTAADAPIINFELTKVYVIKPNDQYAVTPFSTGVLTVPADAASFDFDQSKSDFEYLTGALSTQRSIYMPEADVFMSANGKPGDSNHTNRMAIVVGGKYMGRGETFYRLDFAKLNATTSKRELMNVLRNHLYQFNISSVSGDGFKDVETAYNSLAMNMTVDILEWNEADMGDINFDGTYYFSVSDRKVEFTPFGGEIKTVTIKTNAEDFEMWDTDLNGSTFQMKASTTQLTYGPLANGFKYTLARTGSTDIYTLTIECQNSNVSSSIDNIAHWKFVANRISVPFEVNQQCKFIYSVNYDANGGSGAPTPSAKWFGTDITLSPTIPTYNERIFKGWSLSSNATTATWAAGASGVTDAALGNASGSASSVTLYAVWESDFIVESRDAAPRIYVYGTGNDAKLMFTKSPINYGAFFQFGSVIAWHSNNTMNSAIFNPSLSVVNNWNSNWTSNVDLTNVTVQNLKEGKGDPCRLVGYTLQFIKDELAANRVPDNKVWRLPNRDENNNIYSGGTRFFGTIIGINGYTFSLSPEGTFLPAAGYRNYINGTVTYQGANGYYWSSTPLGGNGYFLYFNNGNVIPQGNYLSQANGFPVRCVRQ